jgi:hypothetical protein
MHDQRSDPWPAFIARPGTPAYEHQRRLVLELAAAPPGHGDRPAELARVLDLPLESIEAAADALVAAGLAQRRGGRLLRSDATAALDALWPVAM